MYLCVHVYSDDEEGGLKMRWYQAVDGEDSSGGLCVSMSPVSSATSPSTSAASPAPLAKLERSGTHSPRDATVSPVGKVVHKIDAPSSKEVRTIPKVPQKGLKEKEKSEKDSKVEGQEVIPSVPARTVSLTDNMASKKGAVSGLLQLEPETKTIGASTSYTDGGAISRIGPRRNTVGARPLNNTAPPLPPKSKPVKPPAPPPPDADDDVQQQTDVKPEGPVNAGKFGYSSSAISRSHLSRFNNGSKSISRIKPPNSKSPVQTRSSSDQRPKRDKPKGNREVPTTAVTSRTVTSRKAEPPNPLNHDYAVLEQPLDHDYAILDPEYHEEFYGG